MTGHEKEFKFILTQEEYERIRTNKEQLELIGETTYWNIYYDNPHGDLHRAGYTYRMSLVENGEGRFRRPKLTFKGPKHKTEHGLHSCEEVEQYLPGPLTKDDFFLHYTLLLPDAQHTEPWKKIAHMADGHPYLYVVGSIKICRTKFMYDGFIIELDRVSYSSDAHDFELEVETHEPETTYPLIVEFLKRHGIKPTPSHHGKQSRFWKFRKQHGMLPPFTW